MSTTTPTVVAPLVVKTLQLPIPNATSYGTGLTFDFTKECGSNQSVLGYSVGISGFEVYYATQSNDSYEDVAQFAINLVPNLVNNQIMVTANIILTDYDGDAASESQDVSDRQSVVVVTCLAIIGETPSTNWSLVNIFGQPAANNSPGSANLPVPPGFQYNQAFVSGFNFAYSSGDTHGVLGLYATVNNNAGTASNTVSLSGEATMDPSNNYSGNTSMIDLGLIAAANPGSGEIQNFQIAGVSPSWGSLDDGNGISGTFSHSVTGIPDGYQIQGVAYLMTIIDLAYGGGNYHDISTIAAGLTSTDSLTVNSSNTVSGTVVMNVFADESDNRTIDGSSSNLDGFLIIAFEPIPAS